MNRRKFSKAAASLALAVPALHHVALAEAEAEPQEPQAAAPPARRYGMSKEQEERVKQAIERGERGRAALRAHPLAYSAEPAFVFRARRKQ
jgi:hypothetical protein